MAKKTSTKAQADAGAAVKQDTKKTEDAGLEQRRKDAERIKKEAEEGTGLQQDQGYHGSSDYQEPRNFNTDPGQASDEQIRQQRAAQRES